MTSNTAMSFPDGLTDVPGVEICHDGIARQASPQK